MAEGHRDASRPRDERDRSPDTDDRGGDPDLAARRALSPGKIRSSSLIGDPDPPRWYRVLPGKRRVSMGLPVEADTSRDAQRTGADTDVRARAAGGVSGPGQPLPHRKAIQASFGRHDVSGIEAHVGGAAAEAAGAIGADAYATGDRVGFASPPDLHTAAHEAAHVVQQRAAGVSSVAALGGGTLTSPGDAAERHADLVADRVVRGESAQELLDHSPPVGAAIARKTDKKPDPSGGFPLQAPYYMSEHADAFFAAIRSHLAGLSLPTGHARLRWTATAAIVAVRATHHLRALSDENFTYSRLPGLLAPLDPWRLIDTHRDIIPSTAQAAKPEGPRTWSPAAGVAIAHAVEKVLRASLERMGSRYVAKADQTHGQVPHEQLVTSHPFDRITTRLLADDRLVAAGRPSERERRQPADGSFAGGLRLITHYEWQGARDPRLWNWLRVIDPPDATAEEVSMVLFRETGEEGEPETQRAYGITAAPPFFRIPPAWARNFRDAARLAPERDDDTSDGSPHALGLAGSSLADTAALAQVAGRKTRSGRASRGDVLAAIDRSQRQIDTVRERLAAWKTIAPRLVPAREWLARRAAALAAADDTELQRWAPVIAQQQNILFEASGETIAVLELAARSGASGADAPAQAPIREVLAAYATVIGESHLVDSARAALAGARVQRANLPIALSRLTVRDSSQAASELAEETGRGPGSEGAGALEVQQQIERDQLALEKQAIRGMPADADAIDAVSLRAAEHSFASRLAALRQKMERLDQMLEGVDRTAVQSVANSLAGDVRELRGTMAGIRSEIARIERVRVRASRGDTVAFEGDMATRGRARRQAGRTALSEAEHSLANLAKREDFEKLSQRVRNEVADAQMRALIGEILLLIGTSVLSAGIAGAVGGATRGVMLARTTGNAARLLAAAPRIRLASGAVQLGTEAALNAAFQTFLTGDATGAAFVENLLSDAGTLVALAPLRRLITRVGAADEAVKGLWQKAGRAGKLALRNAPILTAEMIIGAAASYGAHMAVYGRPDTPEDVTGWLVQGASMAVGRFVAGRMTGLMERMDQLAERGAFLKTHAAVQRQRAEHVVKSGDKDQALDLLAAQKQLLDKETELLSALEHDAAARDKAGLSPHQLGLLRQANTEAQAHMAGPAYDELPFRLERLEEIVPGARWSGDPEQITAALDHARRTSVPVEVVSHDPATGRWDIRLRGRPMVLDEKLRGGKRTRRQKVVFEEADKLRAKDIISVPEARRLHQKARAAGVPVESLPKASTPEQILKAKGMTDREIELYKQTLNKSQQASMTDKDKAEYERTTGKRIGASASKDALGRTRAAATPEQTQAALKANIILYEQVQEGVPLTKVIPEEQVGGFLVGETIDSSGKSRKTTKMAGDIGPAASTEGMTAEQKVRYLGLDYEDNPFVDRKPDGTVVVKESARQRLYEIEQQATQEQVENALVPMGYDMYRAALLEAQRLKAEGKPLPRLLELDAHGELRNIVQRNRGNQNDPSAGFGYTASMILRSDTGEQFFRPNQELNAQLRDLTPGAELIEVDERGNRKVVARFDGTRFVPVAGLTAADAARLNEMAARQRHQNDSNRAAATGP